MKFTSTKKQVHAAPVILFHGQPNTGKTIRSASAVVNGKPPLLLLFERGGTESLTVENINRVFGPNRPDICYDIPVLECFDDGDADGIVATLEASKDDILKGSEDMPKGAGCIIVDSMSAASTVVLSEAKALGLTHGQQVYGYLAERVTELVRGIIKFCNENGLPVIFQAQSTWSEEPGTGEQVLYPVFEGKKLLTAIPHEVYEVWAAFCATDGLEGKPEYGIQLLRGGNIFAKSRWGAVEKAIGEDAHIGKLIEMKMGKRKVPTHLRLKGREDEGVTAPEKPAAKAGAPAKTLTGSKAPATPPANKPNPASAQTK